MVVKLTLYNIRLRNEYLQKERPNRIKGELKGTPHQLPTENPVAAIATGFSVGGDTRI